MAVSRRAPAVGSQAEESLSTLLRWDGLPEPVREHRFAPPRRWRFDFAWIAERVACEVEGGAFSGGHKRYKAYESDCEKQNEAMLQGWRVLRVTPAMVDDGRAIEVIRKALFHKE